VSSSGTAANPFQWNGGSGYYADAESDLQKVGARYYEPATGRWISQDSLLIAGSPADSQAVNRYLYCGANPIAGTDPSGHGGDPLHPWSLGPFSLCCMVVGWYVETGIVAFLGIEEAGFCLGTLVALLGAAVIAPLICSAIAILGMVTAAIVLQRDDAPICVPAGSSLATDGGGNPCLAVGGFQA
jgi:RHS repeat-associated protein